MKDMVPKGTGNSRTLKSVANFLTLYPTYNDFAAALVAGTLPIDLGAINSAGCDEVGTPLNKANLLKDATFAKLGVEIVGSEPSVDDAIDILAEFKAGLNSYGKVDPDQLSSRVVFHTLAADDTLTLDSSYKNVTIWVRLTSSSGSASIIVPDEQFDIGDEFEVFIEKVDANVGETLVINGTKDSLTRFNNLSNISMSANLSIAVLKCYTKYVQPAGVTFPDALYWLVKGDI